MKVNVIYNKYNSKIDKADLIFTDELDAESKICLEVVTDTEIIPPAEDLDEEVIVETQKVKITSISGKSIEVDNILSKDDLRTLMSLIRNLLSQL